MSRRSKAKKHLIKPDSQFGSVLIAKFINHIMNSGKKSVAEKIVYTALHKLADTSKLTVDDAFSKVLSKIKPVVEVRSRRVGGATYQIPVEVRPERQLALAMRWLIAAARNRSEKGMIAQLAAEMLDVLAGRGEAVKKCIDTKKMADANQAFAHFR